MRGHVEVLEGFLIFIIIILFLIFIMRGKHVIFKMQL